VDYEEKGDEIIIPCAQIVRKVISLLQTNTPIAEIAMSFHRSLVDVSLKVIARLSEKYNLKTVVLNGGAFQNRILLGMLTQKLKKQGYKILLPQKTPLNDGGIALGQIVIGKEMLK